MSLEAVHPPADTEPQDPAFIGALTTEHFVLQSSAATSVTEASSRASLYVFTLSSSLVAMGFSVKTNAFAPLLATILPVIVVLGIFTTVRLVDTGVQNVQILGAIAHIRGYHGTLAPHASSYFPAHDQGDVAEALASMAVKRQPTTALFTMASMISLINSIVAAAGVSLLMARWLPRSGALAVGAALAIVFNSVFFLYQHRRYHSLLEPRPIPGVDARPSA